MRALASQVEHVDIDTGVTTGAGAGILQHVATVIAIARLDCKPWTELISREGLAANAAIIAYPFPRARNAPRFPRGSDRKATEVRTCVVRMRNRSECACYQQGCE